MDLVDRRVIAVFALVGALRPSAPPVATRKVSAARSSGNRAHDALLQLSATDQATQLAAIVRSAGESCAGGSDAYFQGLYAADNSAFWNIRCSGGTAFSISIAADAGGSTKVLSCNLLQAVAKVQCFAPLK